jgi:hypothetical protein
MRPPKLQILGGTLKKIFGADAPTIVPPNFRDKSPLLADPTRFTGCNDACCVSSSSVVILGGFFNLLPVRGVLFQVIVAMNKITFSNNINTNETIYEDNMP